MYFSRYGRSGFDVTEMGTEKRLALWVVRHPDDPKRMKSQPIPAEVVAKLTQSGA